MADNFWLTNPSGTGKNGYDSGNLSEFRRAGKDLALSYANRRLNNAYDSTSQDQIKDILNANDCASIEELCYKNGVNPF